VLATARVCLRSINRTLTNRRGRSDKERHGSLNVLQDDDFGRRCGSPEAELVEALKRKREGGWPVSWYRSRYLNIGISGFLSASLVIMILLALMGIRVGEKNPGVAYRAETPER
jgi:hypothetical protein